MSHIVRADRWYEGPPNSRHDRYNYYAPGECRVLMKDGKWQIPPGQRPKLAPPPREETPIERRVLATIPSNLWIGRGVR